MKGKQPLRLVGALFVILASATIAAAQTGHDHDTDDPSKDRGGYEAHEVHLHGSLSDTARQANNPLSTLWTLQNQFDIKTFHDIPLAGGGSEDGEVGFTWNFQPVLPLHLNDDWNLINRAVLPFLEVNPVPDGSGEVDHPAEFGDIILANILAPNKSQGFIYGLGTTWSFPSASSNRAGSGKWQLGPAAGAFYVGKEWIFGVFPQQWFSIGGDGDRSDVSFLDMQYFVWRLFPGGWQVGFTQDLTVDWKARSGDEVTFPIGIGVGRTFKIGGHAFKIDGQVSYAVVHPDLGGQRWGFRVRFTPIIKALCCTGRIF
ncbi:MAG: hypothetical protein OEU56_26015 [Rhodospirillales bacterium]|nr:hypothetical protein [Rhodospirillales bacterium]